MDFRGYVQRHLPPLAIAREREIVDELAEHLADLYQEGRASGLDHDAAWTHAVAALPAAADEFARALRTASRHNVERLADRVQAALDEPVAPRPGGLTMVTDLRRDVRYALRALMQAPGFAVVAVSTLALGIGATTVIFSAVDAVLLRSAPAVADPGRVVSVYTRYAARATTNPDGGDRMGTSSYPDYLDLRDAGALEGLAAFAEIRPTLDLGGVAEAIDAEVVSGNYFDVLGVKPVVGRAFTPDEDRAGSPLRVAVLAYGAWVRHFGRDPGVVGRSITLNGRSHTVVGVAPRGFLGVTLGRAPDLWVPMALQAEVRPPSAGPLRLELGGLNMLGARGVRWLDMVGRLRPGDAVDVADSALDVIGRRLAAAYPESNRELSARAVPLGDGPGFREDARPLLGLLSAAVLLLLLIACANVASLLLARAVSRRREVAVRMALGAGRGQLVRQWLTEAALLGLLGAAGGVLVASWGMPILYGLGVPASIDLSLNARVLAFTLVAGVGTGLLFGLAPVVQLIRRETLSALREEAGSLFAGSHATRLRRAFVVLQVGLSLVLLIGAGLLIRTLQQAYDVDLGYRVDRMLLADVSPPDDSAPEAGEALYAALLDRANALPGVVAAGAARVAVLSGGARTVAVSLDGQPLRRDRSNTLAVRVNVVGGRYLEAMGIAVLRGRGFEPSDGAGADRVALVSRSLAERLWPDADPIGQTLVWASAPVRVVGIVPDSVYVSPTERAPRPFFYVPLSQNYEAGVTLHVRTSGDPTAILPALRQSARELDPRIVLVRPRRLLDEFDRSVGEQRTMAILASAFGGIALLLAAVGLYGVMAYATRQRIPEIGLRMALGATPASIMTGIVASGAVLVTLGTGMGLTGALASVRFVQGWLFGVEPTDPATWLGVVAVLVAVGVAACAIPAWRAMRTDPAVALRNS